MTDLGKLKQIDARRPHLHEERAPASPFATIGTPTGQLDVETVVKASQALSSEIVLDSLIEQLMRIAVEHAGAERGLLILLRGTSRTSRQRPPLAGQGRRTRSTHGRHSIRFAVVRASPCDADAGARGPR